MAVSHITGVLKKVLLANPVHWELLPLSDTARDALDRGNAVDTVRALAEHDEFADAFRQAGVEVYYVDPISPAHKWQGAARDWGLMTPKGAVIGKFRYFERKGEEVPAFLTVKRLGYPLLGRVTNGALEGGDCWYIDEHTVAIGFGNRSTWAGVKQAMEILSKADIEVIPVELHARWNHLDMVFSVLGEKVAVGCSDALPDYFKGFLKGRGFEVRYYGREYVEGQCTLNLVPLGNGRVMSFRDNRINKDLRAMGFEVFDPNFSQFTLGGGGPHCFCHELERE